MKYIFKINAQDRLFLKIWISKFEYLKLQVMATFNEIFWKIFHIELDRVYLTLTKLIYNCVVSEWIKITQILVVLWNLEYLKKIIIW